MDALRCHIIMLRRELPLRIPRQGRRPAELISWFHGYPGELDAVLSEFLGEERNFWDRVLSKTPLSEMAVADYERLMEAFGPRLAKDGNPSEVVYLSKSERLKHMVIVREGLLYLGIETKLHTLPVSQPANGWLYALDRYGNLFCGTTKGFDRIVEGGIKRINHSSFNADKDVIVAGVIYAKNGKLTYLDNASGHYQASREQLEEFIHLLEAEEVDLTGVEVGSMQPVAPADRNKVPRGEAVAFYLFPSVAQFLSNQGGVLHGEPAQGPPRNL